jgi:hypothetical protein
MKSAWCVFFLVLFSSAALSAEDKTPPADTDVDSLFTDDNADTTTAEPKEPDILSDLLPTGFTLGADVSLITGYSPGLNYLPGDVADLSQIAYADMAIFDMAASLSFDVRFTPDLKLFSRLSACLPDFRAEIQELFCDFNVQKAVFIRMGRHSLTWGISPNYPFTNLLGFVPIPQDQNTDAADSIACKINIPLGVGGIDLVAFSRTSLWDAPDQPTVDEIGIGSRFNLALPNFDFSIGGYYHKDLPLRFYYSLKTTLFGTVETYTEGQATTNLLSLTDPSVATWYLSANLGVYFDLFAKALKVNAEYYYCGETSDLTQKGASFTLFPGHNLALNTSWSLAGGQVKLLFQGKYNISQNSGYMIPAATLDVIPNVTFSLAVPFIVGPITGGYFVQNVVSGSDNRRICLILAVIVKASI